MNDDIATMSKRVREVWGLLAKGYTAKKIGKELCITEATAKTHINCLYAALELPRAKDGYNMQTCAALQYYEIHGVPYL